MGEHEPPRWAFAKGALIGFVVALPAVATTVWLLARLGLGDADRSFAEVLRFAILFAGAPAVLTAGGVARLAARSAAADTPSPLAIARASALPFAAAGIGLVLLTAIPLGDLPTRSAPWLWYALAGSITGAAVGAVIALWAAAR